jgi:hypothetical protein
LSEPKKKTNPSNVRDILLNIAIILLCVMVIYLSYSFVMRNFVNPPVQTKSNERVIQIDVLNGCGIPGVAIKFTDFLRVRGFDVLEMGNYKSFDVQETLVIDRTGKKDNAHKVAYALGIDEKNIIQQVSPDSYLDCTVVIGKDFNNLKPMK